MATVEVDHSVYWRQLDIINPDALARIPITMIGVGGLGSPMAMLLSKMGVQEFEIYDDDTIEIHNVPNQMYTLRDIGQPKAEAISGVIAAHGGVPNPRIERYESQPLKGLVIVTVDNMAGRSKVWETVKFNPNVPLLIDARMGAEEGRVFAVNPADLDSIKHYESSLYSDDDAIELPCTAQSIIYNTFGMAALVGRLVKGFANGEDLPKELILDSIQFAVYKL